MGLLLFLKVFDFIEVLLNTFPQKIWYPQLSIKRIIVENQTNFYDSMDKCIIPKGPSINDVYGEGGGVKKGILRRFLGLKLG